MLSAKQVFDSRCHPRAPPLQCCYSCFWVGWSMWPLFIPPFVSCQVNIEEGGSKGATRMRTPFLMCCDRLCIYADVVCTDICTYIHTSTYILRAVIVYVSMYVYAYARTYFPMPVCLYVCSHVCFDSQCQEYLCLFPVYVQSAYSLRTVCVPVCNVIFHSLRWVVGM